MTAPTVEAPTDTDTQPESEAQPLVEQSARFRRGLLAILVVALLVSSGMLIWLASDRTGSAADLASDREQVMSASQQFVLRVNTYGPDLLDDKGQMPEYRRLVEETLTTKFKASFEQSAAIPEGLVKQAGASRTADVYATGVSSIDADSSTVIVAGAFTTSYNGKVAGEPIALRLQLSLLKVDGKWLIDNYTPVQAADPGAGQ